MKYAQTYLLLLFTALACSTQSYAFQVKGGREPAPPPTPEKIRTREPRRASRTLRESRRLTGRLNTERPSPLAPADDRATQHVQEGLRHAEAGEWAQAIQAYRRAVDIEPKYANALIGLGDAYMSAGNYQAAFDAYRRAVAVAPRHAEAYYSLGAAYNDMGLHGDAFKPLTSAVQLDPSFAEAYYGIGYAYYMVDKFKEAVGFLRSALRIDPDYAEAHLILGLTSLRLGQVRAAEEQLRKLEGLPGTSLLVEELGRELRKAAAAPPPTGLPAGPEARVRKDRRGQRQAVDEAGGTRAVAAPKGIAALGQVAVTPKKEEAIPPDARPKQVVESIQPNMALEVELRFWESIRNSVDPEEFAAYLMRYPQGQFADLARIRMNALKGRKKVEPAEAEDSRAPGPAATPAASESPPASPPPPGQETAAHAQPPATATTAGIELTTEAKAPPSLEETIEWLRRNFSAKFTYNYTLLHETASGVIATRKASVDFEALRFDGCKLVWRVFNDMHRVSLADLDPLGVKSELQTAPGTTYSIDVWNVTLTSVDGKEVFEKIEGGRGGAAKKYQRLVLAYDDKEKAMKLAAAFIHAIRLCGYKDQP